MRIALEEAARGKAEGNIAVGSIIVQGETVVARGRNLVRTTLTLRTRGNSSPA